jgi:hypothetical protein
MGGKHGPQKGQPKSTPRPDADRHDGDVAVKRDGGETEERSAPTRGRSPPDGCAHTPQQKGNGTVTAPF